MDDLCGFDHIQSMLSFFEDIDGEDSGVEDLPFTNYAEIDGIIEKTARKQKRPSFEHDEDELLFIDDDTDEDYKPKKAASVTKKGNSKTTKRRQYPNTCVSSNKVVLLTPEKQMISAFDSDGNSNSMRHYARKDRTPNTIKKMMEKHRESERVRHHSLNESLKDVCMHVPGYDPGTKETKVIQMQRIIGYECFLENTLRGVCEQLGVPVKHVMKTNTQFISDTLSSTPLEDFYQLNSYRTSDGDEEDDFEDQDQFLKLEGNDLLPGCRLIRSSHIDDNIIRYPREKIEDNIIRYPREKIEDNIIRYPREKISSPTVDSTTDNFICVAPLSHMVPYQDMQNTPRYVTKYELHSQWPPQTGFKPIESSQSMYSSQESGIKIETQSSTDDDCHFHEVNRLMEEGLYNDSEQLRTVTPSFMHEETVTTSTYMEDTDEGFDLSSPVRYTDSVFLHSPPLRGIWHSANKLHLPDKADTPLRKEMEGVSPENILETRQNVDNRREPNVATSASFQSRIRPMTEILVNKGSDPRNVESGLDLGLPYLTEKYSCGEFMGISHTPQSYSRSNTNVNFQQLNDIGKALKDPLVHSLASHGDLAMKSAPMKNVKVRIIHASPSQRNLGNKLMSSTISSLSPDIPLNCVSPQMSKVVHLSPELFQQTDNSFTRKENCSPGQVLPLAVTQLKKIPVPVLSALQQIQLPVGSQLQSATDFESTELRNKRKRYTPFRSPFSDRTNQDSDDESWSVEHKRRKADTLEHGLGTGTSRMLKTVKRSKGNATSGMHAGQDIRNSPKKIDYRRSTWMNGFMMFSQINRQKYLSEHPGIHVSVVQKLLGHKWRNMSEEEQLPYREKADEYSGYGKQCQQTCTASVADSSTGPYREAHAGVLSDRSQQELESAVLTITPGQW